MVQGPADFDARTVESVAAHFEELASALHVGEKVELERLTDLVTRVLSNAEHAGITLIRHRRHPHTMAATDQLPREVDHLQYELNEGPCLAASTGHDVVLSRDLAVEERWNRFSEHCVELTGIRSMLSVRLALSDHDRAALNFYSGRVDAFDDDDLMTGAVLAPFVALHVERILHQRDVADLSLALESNRQIGIAIGILMNQLRITEKEAFDRLRVTSQHLNRKLREIAEEVRFTGELPELPPTRAERRLTS